MLCNREAAIFTSQTCLPLQPIASYTYVRVSERQRGNPELMRSQERQ